MQEERRQEPITFAVPLTGGGEWGECNACNASEPSGVPKAPTDTLGPPKARRETFRAMKRGALLTGALSLSVGVLCLACVSAWSFPSGVFYLAGGVASAVLGYAGAAMHARCLLGVYVLVVCVTLSALPLAMMYNTHLAIQSFRAIRHTYFAESLELWSADSTKLAPRRGYDKRLSRATVRSFTGDETIPPVGPPDAEAPYPLRRNDNPCRSAGQQAHSGDVGSLSKNRLTEPAERAEGSRSRPHCGSDFEWFPPRGGSLFLSTVGGSAEPMTDWSKSAREAPPAGSQNNDLPSSKHQPSRAEVLHSLSTVSEETSSVPSSVAPALQRDTTGPSHRAAATGGEETFVTAGAPKKCQTVPASLLSYVTPTRRQLETYGLLCGFSLYDVWGVADAWELDCENYCGYKFLATKRFIWIVEDTLENSRGNTRDRSADSPTATWRRQPRMPAQFQERRSDEGPVQSATGPDGRTDLTPAEQHDKWLATLPPEDRTTCIQSSVNVACGVVKTFYLLLLPALSIVMVVVSVVFLLVGIPVVKRAIGFIKHQA